MEKLFNLLFILLIISIIIFIFYNCINYVSNKEKENIEIEKKIEQGLL